MGCNDHAGAAVGRAQAHGLTRLVPTIAKCCCGTCADLELEKAGAAVGHIQSCGAGGDQQTEPRQLTRIDALQ
eukprot:1156631-Pelagomonas_calceolata.AAC.1